jgi:hypothetical protein
VVARAAALVDRAGKLLGLVPIAIAAPVVAVADPLPVLLQGGSVGTSWPAVLGLTAGALAASAISAMIATLLPRFAVPIAVCWLSAPRRAVGALDLNGVHVIAASFGARAMADGGGVAGGALSAGGAHRDRDSRSRSGGSTGSSDGAAGRQRQTASRAECCHSGAQ